MDIHKIVNANGLLRKCIDVIPERKGESLVVAYKTKMAFDKYVGSDASDLECAIKLTEFIHRGKSEGSVSTYKKWENGDNSRFSAYDVFSNVLKGESETGDCIGTSQVGAYLLESKGMDVRALSSSNHVLLEADVIGNWITVETTREKGLGFVPKGAFVSEDVSSLEVQVINSQGGSLIEKGESDLAIKYLTKALKLNKKFRLSYNNLGAAWSGKGENDLAIKYFTKAMQLDKKFVLACSNRGSAFYEKGKYCLSVKDYTKALKLDKKNIIACNGRGKAFLEKGENDLAIKDFTKALSLDAGNIGSYHGRGTAFLKKGETDLAIRDYAKCALLYGGEALEAEYLRKLGYIKS